MEERKGLLLLGRPDVGALVTTSDGVVQQRMSGLA